MIISAYELVDASLLGLQVEWRWHYTLIFLPFFQLGKNANQTKVELHVDMGLNHPIR